MIVSDFIKRILDYGTKQYGLHYNEFVLFGVRGYSVIDGSMVKNDDKIDEYNDLIFLLGTNSIPRYYIATMDPGLTWLRKAMNPLGTARLKEGLYKYKIGIHRGHPALTQYASVTVLRYKEHTGDQPWISWKDEKPSIFQTGWFGIDIHAKGGNTAKVGVTSAGCSVIDSTWEGTVWKEFFSLLKSASHVQNFYYYAVLDQATVEKLIVSDI
ncbi:hypothetical protein EHQ24_17325 [Leptospira noumeaensis]|uniref:Uncharacterized protein n=1 Tax=Leptospira noumeaensis TaxID=2484964 RepID=A0A4V3JJ18_9LEPT|nr:hypothetical protein [Leptospira noumeaensis]TGK78316.1 hypothetical protein EHQ24_17325 [Leptospira noumeaensis]